MSRGPGAVCQKLSTKRRQAEFRVVRSVMVGLLNDGGRAHSLAGHPPHSQFVYSGDPGRGDGFEFELTGTPAKIDIT